MRRGVKLAFVSALALACSCIALVRCKTDDCNETGHTVYECSPQPADLPGCTGDVPDATFPVGCPEALPCTAADRTQRICNCERLYSLDDSGVVTASGFGWTCGI
jgi:hypothetical protein